VRRMYEGADMRVASETSGEESEGQEVTGAHAVTQGRRSQWTEYQDPVKHLRQQEQKGLEAMNDTSLGAIFGEDPRAVMRTKAGQPNAKWLTIYSGDITENAIIRFYRLPELRERLRGLQPSAACTYKNELRHSRALDFLAVKFSSKHKGRVARNRIIEEHILCAGHIRESYGGVGEIDAQARVREVAARPHVPDRRSSVKPLLCPKRAWRAADAADHRHRTLLLVYPDRPSPTPDLGYTVPARGPPSLADLSTVHKIRTQHSQDWLGEHWLASWGNPPPLMDASPAFPPMTNLVPRTRPHGDRWWSSLSHL
jgi:hypothetical protein